MNQRALVCHGGNLGDCLFAAQRAFTFGGQEVVWCTDIYARHLFDDFLIPHTNVPIVAGKYYATQNSGKVDKAKFVPYRRWTKDQWVQEMPGYTHYDIVRNSIRRNLILDASKGHPTHIKMNNAPKRNMSTILLVTETWSPNRQYPHWKALDFESFWSGNLLELKLNQSAPQQYPRADTYTPQSVLETAHRMVGTCAVVVAISTFGAALAASLNVPVVVLHPHASGLKFTGSGPLGGRDLTIQTPPEKVREVIQDAIEHGSLVK